MYLINYSAWSVIYNLLNVTADRDARRSDGSDKGEAVRQQGITKY